jgi:hypothetical protein
MAAVLLASSPAARASPIAYEGFAMPLPSPFGGGAGFAAPWASTPGFHGYSWSPSTLSVTGLQASGGSVSGAASLVTSGFAYRDFAPPVASHSTLYLSFLLQPHGTLNEGTFGGFFGLLLSGASGGLFVGKPGGGAFDQYVLETVGGFGQVASGVPVVASRTALLVVKAQLSAGNDVFTLYVDPPVKGGEPAVGAVKSDLDLGNLLSVGIYAGGAFAIDEIRVGTTWADAVALGK